MKIIKIGAVWCPGCLVMKKVWNKITNDYPNLDIKEYDLDLNLNELDEIMNKDYTKRQVKIFSK